MAFATAPAPAASPSEPSAGDSAEAAKARSAFDEVDSSGVVPVDRFEDLLDSVGEGFHGDELEAQRARVDDGSGKITREAFARYYVALVENADESDDSGDEEEREEERGNAREAFDAVADGATSVPSSKFQALMEALGTTTYCEEEHRRTLRKLAPGGTVARDAFVEWYVDWVLGDGSDTEEATTDDDVASRTCAPTPGSIARPHSAAK